MEKNVRPIDQYYHEAMMARMERTNRRWFIAWLVTFLTLVVFAVCVVVYENQFEEVSITHEVTQDTEDGGNNSYDGKVVGGDYYGDAENQNNN